MKIAVAGTGYVGLSNAILLSQHNEVHAVDVVPEKVRMINEKKSPIVDKEIEEYLATKELNLTATLDGCSVYKDADYIIKITGRIKVLSINYLINLIIKKSAKKKKWVIAEKLFNGHWIHSYCFAAHKDFF